MAPTWPRKRKSDQSTSSFEQRSPIKKRKMGLTLPQKQALIENLQLEITERARRLRAQYNVQAQQLRSRVEMRVNRIPRALRRLKMADLLAKHSEPAKSRPARSPYVARPPPVPTKDGASPKPIPRKPVSADGHQRGFKRLSDGVVGFEDKENSVEPVGQPKKKGRGPFAAVDAARTQPSQVLSPTSTNLRVLPRAVERPTSPAKHQTERPASSPTKSMIARPGSPSKGFGAKSTSNLLSNMVEKAKSTRGGTTGRHKLASSTITNSSATSGTTRGRKPGVPSSATTANTRGKRKNSQASESSEASTGTVIKKTTAASRAAPAKSATAPKRTVMGTIKSATTKKPATAKPAAAPAATGRTLRKRQA
ncbi:hypothetical protein JX265_005458 [Neoarthrinium moseri]|uniref:Borealin N-terminal domain-containing protein n=1 Tax=Neoarthrinium moseri TaxID=1658444 RepID=A0A9P9WNV5_9PEZI|nr:hypothetical protein JX265_005458 [Neoarthrinium moseri]